MSWLIASILAFAAAAGADQTLPVQDGDFACIERARAESYVRDFNIDVESFGGLELCDAHVDSKKLFNDLRLLEEGRFTGEQANLFIRDFVPRDTYFVWLKSQTYGIHRGNDVPYATAYNSGGQFTMQDGWSKLSTLGRVGTVVHEARHTEGYSHRICTHGPYKDTSVSGCDENVDEAGAHAIEMEYYARVVAQGANFHPVYQEMARLMLIARSNFVFNESPLSARDALVARTDDGLIEIKGQRGQAWQWQRAPSVNAQLKRTSFGVTLYSAPIGAEAVSLINGEPAARVEDQYSYFKFLLGQPPAGLRDFEEYDIGLNRYVTALDERGQLFRFLFADGQWTAPVNSGGAIRLTQTAPTGAEGIFAINGDGTYCPLAPNTLRCQSGKNSWPAGALAFVNYGRTVLRLNEDGRVVDMANEQVWPQLQGQHVLDLVKIPAYDVFDAELIY